MSFYNSFISYNETKTVDEPVLQYTNVRSRLWYQKMKRLQSALSKVLNLLQCESVCKQRGIVQRLVHRSPKPEIVVRFHVPLPSISKIKKVSEMEAFCYS